MERCRFDDRGGASFLEAGAGEAFGVAIAADSPALAATSAPLGLVSAVTLPLSLMSLGIYEAVNGVRRVEGFENAAMPEL